jgi:hypothetical protein
MTPKLLTREEFNEVARKRDNYCCVMCGSKGCLSVHHVIEHKLFPDGGRYIDNAATLCSDCHLKAEQTIISPKTLREKIGVVNPIYPPGYGDDTDFDKWMNPVLINGRRLKGPMFNTEQVQKVLKKANLLDIFDDYVKYPKTPHLEYSNTSSDDKYIDSMEIIENEEIIVSEKWDGENSQIYSDGYYHARSLDGRGGEDRSVVASIAARIERDLPRNWRIAGENVYAQHSIIYNSLESLFYVFSIWDENNNALSWDETVEWCELLDLTTVPVLYRGKYDKELIHSLFTPVKENGDEMEGYVIRVARSFHISEFGECVVKWVRPNHVTTTSHWRYKAIKKNGLITNYKI